MMPTIRIDDEVYAWLQQQAQPFEDTPNSVLRRVARLGGGSAANANSKRPNGVGLKFSALDRQLVVSHIEGVYGTKLARIPVGRKKKYYKDEAGKPYWIFGGLGDWHSFTTDVFDHEELLSPNGSIVIAKKTHNSMSVFVGDMKEFLPYREVFVTNVNGDIQFDLAWIEGSPHIKNCPNVKLRLIGELDLTRK